METATRLTAACLSRCRGMVPPARQNSPAEPTAYFFAFEEGLWQLSKPRGTKGTLVKVDSYRTCGEARTNAIARAKADSYGASMAISTVVNYRRR